MRRRATDRSLFVSSESSSESLRWSLLESLQATDAGDYHLAFLRFALSCLASPRLVVPSVYWFPPLRMAPRYARASIEIYPSIAVTIRLSRSQAAVLTRGPPIVSGASGVTVIFFLRCSAALQRPRIVDVFEVK